MLKWIVRLCRGRIRAGRQVLLGNPWQSEAWRTKELEPLQTVVSPAGSPFELARGDQCVCGASDVDSGFPYQKATAFGATS
eukprot:15193329-Alexandrium_andersonii.AAC.1